MKIKNDWWKNFFNEIYLITDSRSVCDPKLTLREVNLIEKTLDLNKHETILDLCGGYGRHSLELARRGYQRLTVLDYSDYQIKLGRTIAKKENLKIRFLRKDARASGLKDNRFSKVMIMANSFGYFPEEEENIKVLKEIHRLLVNGGKLLLDLTDSNYLKNNLSPFSWHQIGEDLIICRERELKNDLIAAREIVLSKKKGLLRDGHYCERIYNRKKITRLLNTAGFKNLSVQNDLSLHKLKKDYGLMTSRMFVTAKK